MKPLPWSLFFTCRRLPSGDVATIATPFPPAKATARTDSCKLIARGATPDCGSAIANPPDLADFGKALHSVVPGAFFQEHVARFIDHRREVIGSSRIGVQTRLKAAMSSLHGVRIRVIVQA